MKQVYITAMGAFLPNEPVGNEEMEDYLGRIHNIPSKIRGRILKQNGITQRYYAMDRNQSSTHSNAQMAAEAIEQALDRSGYDSTDVELLTAGTTQSDLPVPGFASLVHAASGIGMCELASFQSVCASGVMALKDAYVKIKAEDVQSAICVGSEFASRLFKSSRYEAGSDGSLDFDAEFLRWMLSDGAGAMLMQDTPHPRGLSLRIEWIDLRSYAHVQDLCMYVGVNKKQGEVTTKGWLDFADYQEAAQSGALYLRQDVREIKSVIQQGVSHYFDLIDSGKIDIKSIDYLCCHYSSSHFKAPIKELMKKGGAYIEESKWFSNLTTKGNTGAASLFIMLEELMYSSSLKTGQQILCMVPESGQGISSFMLLTVVNNEDDGMVDPSASVPIQAPQLELVATDKSEWLIRQLTKVWIDFESDLLSVPIVKKIQNGHIQMSDYEQLLRDLRHQVIDGSQWIARAASNIDIDNFDLRSAFIKHTATEHRDYQLLEKNYQNLGFPLEQIKLGKKNIGSQALSDYMFQRASNPNPIELLGAMFIIEGIGKRLAGPWGRKIQDALDLKDDQVSFFTYHGQADEKHFHDLERALELVLKSSDDVAESIVRTARTVAELYKLQLKFLGVY